jgi:NAD(P)-dependent dehydrogenase (short-subunit alcohol dehydrogenase family)
MRCIVITGAAGNLGQRLLPHLEARGHLVRPVDRVAIPHPCSLVTDLSRPGDWHKVFAGADTLVHLAGVGPPGAQWTDLVADNIDAWLHVLDAASRHGVSRIVLASSVWANRGRRTSRGVISAGPADPGNNSYGITKALAERTLAAFVARSGATGIAVRIGARPPRDVTPVRIDDWEDSCWLGPNDFLNGLTLAVEVMSDGFHVVNLVSENPTGRWSLDEARDVLGFVPSERSEPQGRRGRVSRLMSRLGWNLHQS